MTCRRYSLYREETGFSVSRGTPRSVNCRDCLRKFKSLPRCRWSYFGSAHVVGKLSHWNWLGAESVVALGS